MPVKMADDPWLDSRSLSSFQTFPRAVKTSVSNFSLSPCPSPSLDVTICTRTRPPLLTPNGHCTPSAWAVPGSWAEAEADNDEDDDDDFTRDVELIDSLFDIEEPRDTREHQSGLVWDIEIGLGARDRRFGFSVVGGSDEGLAPRIDEITPGSPADRADLEVGDEILEVNGKSLEDATHTEVISHIHQCIKSRTICLRVKRKTGNRLALDLAQNSNVQDAFVIAVEQQAKERLEKLSALQQIKPVDMTKLSQQLSQESPTSSQELNGIIEENPIYVTSVPNLATNTAATRPPPRDQGPSSSSSVSSSSSAPVTGPPPSSAAASSSRPDATLHKTLSSGSGTTVEMELKQSFGEPGSMVATGGHREVAVDVPDSFVGLTKAPPRYPPPASGTRTPTSTLPKTASGKENGSGGTGVARTPVVVPVPPVPAPREQMQVAITKEESDKIKKYQEELRKRREEEERLQKEEEFLRNSLRGSKKLKALEQSPRTPTPPPTPSPPPSTDGGTDGNSRDTSGVVNTAFQLDDDVDLDIGATSSSQRIVKRPLGQLKRIVGTGELISAAQRLQAQLKSSSEEDLGAVHALLQSRAFRGALAVHNKVQEVWCARTPPTPIRSDARDLVQQVLDALHECPATPESAELVHLLNKLEVESLVYTHDKIAEVDAMPSVGADGDLLDRVSQYTEDSIKIIKIEKTNEPLGATVRNEGESVIVGRIVKGGVAEKSGLLHEGDEVLEVNGIEMRGKSVNDVCDILANMTGTLTFLIIPSQDERPKQQPAKDTVMHVKANFDYDPEEDLYIPCRELGISFQKGDILHVINQEDPNWWQAYREGEEDQTLAGLVPSKSFQQQREAIKQTIVGDTNNKEKSKKGAFLCAKKNAKKKKKKVLYNANYNDDFDGEEICTYEEVVLYYPRANRKRPIVLIGPPNIGRHELRQKLMEDVERFAAAIPHCSDTSRPKKDGEVDGQDYYFITRQQFEADIMARKFVEHGEYEKNYYGTSLDAIRTVVNSGKICVLNLHPQSLKILKTSDLKPFVVFVAPPSLEKLRQNRTKMGVSAKDDDLKEIIEKAREMEDAYGHYFDLIIVNSDLERTYNQLLHKINVLEREPQWVPSAWLKNDANRL